MKVKLTKKSSRSKVVYYQGHSTVKGTRLIFAVFLDKQGNPSQYIRVSYWDRATKSYIDVTSHFEQSKVNLTRLELEVNQISPLAPTVKSDSGNSLESLGKEIGILTGKLEELLEFLKLSTTLKG